ncbi:MAG: BamA/TamA family outer membrane protein [Myxococcales bacterium]|jgi:outer membrane protein assembly factor BamA
MDWRHLLVGAGVALAAAAGGAHAQEDPGARGDETTDPSADTPPPAKSSDGFTGLPVAAYLPESGFLFGGYGVYYFRLRQSPQTPLSSVQAVGLVSTEGQLGLQVTPQIFLEQRDWWLRFEAVGRINPDAAFHGLGNDTRVGDEESYTTRTLELESEPRRRVFEGLYVGLFHDLEYRTVEDVVPGGLLDTSQREGIDGGVTSGLGPSLVWDTRDHVFAPRSGHLVSLHALVHDGLIGSEYDFGRVLLDARTYLPLWPDHTLGLQLTAELIVGDGPFDRVAKLGGNTIMRGYIDGRFRGDQAYAAQVEYRFPIHWRFRGVAFLSTGQVAGGGSSLALDGFHVAGGLGLRFSLVPEERIRVRLDAAATPDAIRPYFAPREAF